jgi:hypothetical protein
LYKHQISALNPIEKIKYFEKEAKLFISKINQEILQKSDDYVNLNSFELMRSLIDIFGGNFDSIVFIITLLKDFMVNNCGG